MLQNDALRIITGCFKTTPINVLHHLTGIESLEQRRKLNTVKFIAKSFSSIENSLILKLQLLENFKTRKKQQFPLSRVSSYFQNWSILNKELSNIVRNRRNPTFTTPYKAYSISGKIDVISGSIIEKSDDPNQKFLEFITENHTNSTILYTDGSKILDERCGYSVISIDHPHYSRTARLNGKTSIYTAEAKAIKYNLVNSVIASDSLSVLLTLSKEGLHNQIHPTIASIRQKIYVIEKRNYNLSIIWVPSQVGLIGNEHVDRNAK